MTASSGEFTAISFMGLPNTKLFGQPTRGLTTTNVSIKISDDINLNLAVGYSANRYKQPIRGQIVPDVIVPHTEGSDNAIQAAKDWLQHSSAD
jgi:C-terminal processing protease CtpA/Prc